MDSSGNHQAAGWILWGTAEARRRSSSISRVLVGGARSQREKERERARPVIDRFANSYCEWDGRSRGQDASKGRTRDGSRVGAAICLWRILNIRDTDRNERYMQQQERGPAGPREKHGGSQEVWNRETAGLTRVRRRLGSGQSWGPSQSNVSKSRGRARAQVVCQNRARQGPIGILPKRNASVLSGVWGSSSDHPGLNLAFGPGVPSHVREGVGWSTRGLPKRLYTKWRTGG